MLLQPVLMPKRRGICILLNSVSKYFVKIFKDIILKFLGKYPEKMFSNQIFWSENIKGFKSFCFVAMFVESFSSKFSLICFVSLFFTNQVCCLLSDAFKAARQICEHFHMQAPELDVITADGKHIKISLFLTSVLTQELCCKNRYQIQKRFMFMHDCQIISLLWDLMFLKNCYSDSSVLSRENYSNHVFTGRLQAYKLDEGLPFFFFTYL